MAANPPPPSTGLPPSVEETLSRMCSERRQPLPNKKALEALADLGEQRALQLIDKISSSNEKIHKLDGYIIYMYKTAKQNLATPSSTGDIFVSPQKRPANSLDDPLPKLENRNETVTSIPEHKGISKKQKFLPCFPSHRDLELLLLLDQLEFRKAFLLLSYVGRNKIIDVMSVGDAAQLLRLKNHPMVIFESEVWSKYGQHYLGKESPDRLQHPDWDSRRTHLYYCHVYQDGTYSFKGPCLNTTKTHLQRALGDENILIVKFDEEAKSSANDAISSDTYNLIYTMTAEEGILVGLRHYRFFGFKDGGREEKKKNPSSSAVKFYFVRMESIAPSIENETYILANKTICEARCLFMHLHMTSSMAKYASRFSLILSKTIKLQVDLKSVLIEVIEDVPCRDQNGCDLYEDGERLIHTDGTGYISEDLAMKCPKDITKAKFIKDDQFQLVEKISESAGQEYCVREPPLLIQCRLFKNGLAVKGTLLVNRKLKSGIIQIRPSMIKVEADSTLRNEHSFDSLDVVAISHKPRRCSLSKNLIALLSFGGVPKEFFLDLLRKALEEARIIFSNRRAALRFLLHHGDRDDVVLARRMILSGIPLDEPCLQNSLIHLASEERKGLLTGKLPISESYYLMGTADPTGQLDNNQVCVILENGQVSGDVLVYRNPGLHFGDIHVLKATYVEAMLDVIGNAKYGIIFSTKGQRSMASEIGDGDLDGDMYWVSQNPELLAYYKASPPWKRTYSTPHALHSKPCELSSERLEQELIRQFLIIRKQSNNMGVAADSWLAFMDRLLILGDNNSCETEQMKKTMLHLVDIYYDALDSAKSGKKVKIPDELKAEMYPHYMERANRYDSTSVLGLIYDTVKSHQIQTESVEDIWKLADFEAAEIPNDCLMFWKENYSEYRREMAEAMKSHESKNTSADNIIKKYKRMLYGGATTFKDSTKKVEDIYKDALALYHVTYDYAKNMRDVGKCLFAWKVAGAALCNFNVDKEIKEAEDIIACSPSVLKHLLSYKKNII